MTNVNSAWWARFYYLDVLVIHGVQKPHEAITCNAGYTILLQVIILRRLSRHRLIGHGNGGVTNRHAAVQADIGKAIRIHGDL